MTFSLYQAIIPAFLQQLGSMERLVEKAEAWCAERGLPEAELLARRIAPDMQPLAFQLKSVVAHSLGAIEGAQRGQFSPDRSTLVDSFVPLRDRLGAARDALSAIDPKAVEGFVGRDMAFVTGEHRVPFTADNFLLSVSLPNFYFHCSIAYALLRGEGLAIGKRDYLGDVRRKAD